MQTTVKKRSVAIAGHRTSVSLEAAFWDALREIAQKRGTTLNQLISEIDAGREGNLSSAIRVYVLENVRLQVASAHNGGPPGQTPWATNGGTTLRV